MASNIWEQRAVSGVATNTEQLADIAQDVALKRNTADKIALADMAQDTIDAFNGDGTVPPDGSVTPKKITDNAIALGQTQFGVATKNYVRNDEAFWSVGDYNNSYAYRMISGKVYLPVDTDLWAQAQKTLEEVDLNINQIWLRLFDASNAYLGVINIYSTGGLVNISSTTYPTFSYARVVLTNGTTTTLVLSDFWYKDPFCQIAVGFEESEYEESHVAKIGKQSIDISNLIPSASISLKTGSKPDWKIVFVSDIHRNINHGQYGRIGARHLINALNIEDEIGKIDCVVLLGDLVTNTAADMANDIDHMPEFKTNFLDYLRMPYRACAGNRDLYTNEMWEALFDEHYEKNYILSFKGLDLVVIDAFTVDGEGGTDGWESADIPEAFSTAIVSYLNNSENADAVLAGHWIFDYTNVSAIMNHEKVLAGFCGHEHDITSKSFGSKTLFKDGHYSFNITHDTPWSYRVLQSVSGEISTYIVHPEADYPEIDYSGSSIPALAALGVVEAWTQEYEMLTPTVLKAGYAIKVMYP
jgi:predicted phosphodiesterase